VRKGVELLATKNPFNNIYTLELRFGVGTDEIRELDMLADCLGRVGSEGHPSRMFFDALSALSTTLSATAEPDRFVVELEGPEEHMDNALGLLGELMTFPAFERRPLRQLRREIWGYRRISRKDAVNVGDALKEHVLYGKNSSYRREIGPPAARRISVGRLQRAWRQVQAHEVEIGYVGTKSTDEVATAFASKVGLPAELAPAVKPVIYPRVLPDEPTVYFVPRRDAVQTQVASALYDLVRLREVEAPALGRGNAALCFLVDIEPLWPSIKNAIRRCRGSVRSIRSRGPPAAAARRQRSHAPRYG